MTYPEIEYGKIYRVKTRIAYDVKLYEGCFRTYFRRVVRYVARWRKDEDSYLISESHNVMNTYFHTMPVLDLHVVDSGGGLEPLFTDIEEMTDLDLFVRWYDGRLRIERRDFTSPSCCPLFSILEQSPEYIILCRSIFHIYGFGELRADYKSDKVHFESSTYSTSDTLRCSVMVDRDCNICTTMDIC